MVDGTAGVWATPVMALDQPYPIRYCPSTFDSRLSGASAKQLELAKEVVAPGDDARLKEIVG